MAAKPPGWKRPVSERLKATFGKSPIPPAQTPASQLPTVDTPITLQLEDTNMIFQDGRWVAEGADSSMYQQEIEQLKRELRQVSQERNLLEYKNELLIDMLALSSLDNKVYEEQEKQLKLKLSQSQSQSQRAR